MASPNLSEIVTTTLRNRSGKLADNVTKNNALLSRMKKRGSIDTFDGGRTIVQELEYAENSTYQRYSGYEVLNIQPSDIATAAEYDIKQAAVAVAISGLEGDIQNTGENAIIKLLTSRVKNAEKTMMNNLSLDLYSNGTADSGKQIGGLQLLVADAPQTGIVGGIDRSQWAFWRNLGYSVSANLGAPASTANIVQAMNAVYMATSRGNDHPDLWLGDNNYYTLYLQSLQSIQRVTSDEMAQAGFTSLKFMNSDVVFDGGIGGGCPINHMYALNTDYIKYRPSSSRNMEPLENVQSINQDATVQLITWAGNMTLSNGQLQGVLTP